MDNPLQDIGRVIHELTQGTPAEQQKALETYYTTDAAFIHPFCRVNHGQHSRGQILSIFRWYKILSPQIELDIQSAGEACCRDGGLLAIILITVTAYDDIKQILYITIHQVFTVWLFFGLHHADVVLTTKLQLDKRDKKYYITSQNDLYQTDEFIKFISLPRGIGATLVRLWQIAATLICIIMAKLFEPVTWLLQWQMDYTTQQDQQAKKKIVGEILGEDKRDSIAMREKSF